VRRELVFALGAFALLLVFAMLVPAPLEGTANPDISPNPAKAPWYFMGLQELLRHFHPLVGAIILPSLAILGIFLLPFFDIKLNSVGIYFRSHSNHGRKHCIGQPTFFTKLLTLSWPRRIGNSTSTRIKCQSLPYRHQ
jgi:hypothetical protein